MINRNLLARYESGLSQIPSIGLKKAAIQGLCQIFSNGAIGIVFAAALWYGQYLIKTECQAYSAGTLVVVSKQHSSAMITIHKAVTANCMKRGGRHYNET